MVSVFSTQPVILALISSVWAWLVSLRVPSSSRIWSHKQAFSQKTFLVEVESISFLWEWERNMHILKFFGCFATLLQTWRLFCTDFIFYYVFIPFLNKNKNHNNFIAVGNVVKYLRIVIDNEYFYSNCSYRVSPVYLF